MSWQVRQSDFCGSFNNAFSSEACGVWQVVQSPDLNGSCTVFSGLMSWQVRQRSGCLIGCPVWHVVQSEIGGCATARSSPFSADECGVWQFVQFLSTLKPLWLVVLWQETQSSATGFVRRRSFAPACAS